MSALELWRTTVYQGYKTFQATECVAREREGEMNLETAHETLVTWCFLCISDSCVGSHLASQTLGKYLAKVLCCQTLPLLTTHCSQGLHSLVPFYFLSAVPFWNLRVLQVVLRRVLGASQKRKVFPSTQHHAVQRYRLKTSRNCPLRVICCKIHLP